MFERGGYMTGYYPSRDLDGKEFLLIVVKRTFAIDMIEGKCKPADEQVEILLGDEFNGKDDPFESSIRYESELAPWKVRKDIVFLGKAYAPKGKPLPSWDVRLQVGEHTRALRVFGPRTVTWVPPREEGKGKKKTMEVQPPLIGDPEPVTEVELTYENAYGGFATYFPEDPKAFRKAVKSAKKKADKKKKEKEENEQAKLDAQEKAEAKEAGKEKAKKAEARKRSYFYHGVKRSDEAPDVEFEVELGSRKLMSSGRTVVLDLAEMAEAEDREAEEAAQRLAAEEEAAKNAGPAVSDTGALIAGEDELAEVAAELSEEAAAERAAHEARRILEGDPEDSESLTRVINLADLGDEVKSDDHWIQDQKKERERFYESLGQDTHDGVAWEEGDFPRIPCPSNFVGKGFAMRNCVESLDGLQMPQIEDPNKLLQPEDLPVDPATLHLPTLPQPAGFGFTSKGWVPRSYLAGLLPNEIADAQLKMDKQLLEEFDPEDTDDQQAIDALLDREATELDPAFYNGAHSTFQVDHLMGDEHVTLTNLDASGKSFFALPGRRPEVRFDRGKGWEDVEIDLDTVVIDREGEQVTIVWRGGVDYGGPDEMDEWPRTDIDVHDWTVEEYRDKVHEAALAAALADKTKALVLGEDEVSELENAEFDDRVRQAGLGLGGVKEDKPTELVEKRAADGALVDLQDREDVVLADGTWVKETQHEQLSEEDRLKAQEDSDDRLRVKNAKKALRDKREEDKRKKQEAEEAAAAEEAKKKKSKKKKKPDEPPEDDDDDDLDDDETADVEE